MLKKLFKPMIAVFVAVAIGLGSVTPALAASIYDIDLDTGNRRTNRGLQDEKQLLVNFVSAYNAFDSLFTAVGLIRDVPDQATLQQRAGTVTTANKALQDKNFSDRISDQFTMAAVDVKSDAQDLTELVQQIATDGVTKDQVTATKQRLSDGYDKLFVSIQSLNAGAAAYDPPGGPWVPFVVIGGVILGMATIITVAVIRGNKKTTRLVFGDDPAAQQLTADQRKTVVRLANDLEAYEKALARADANAMSTFEMASYTPLKEKGSDPALGKYAYVIEEFHALVYLKSHHVDAAKASAHKAAHIKGDNHLITAKARELLTTPHTHEAA